MTETNIGPGDAAPSYGRAYPSSAVQQEAYANATSKRGRGAPVWHDRSGEIPQWLIDQNKRGHPQDSHDSR